MIVGIDLGTTTCVIHYFDKGCKFFAALPSCIYLGEETLVGQEALDAGKKIPTRLVHSAKSWLSHPGALLPVEFDQRQMTPLEATTTLLAHIRDLWNSRFEDLEEQEVIITLPASFDEWARNLTLKAAHAAGLATVTLLEEPQAAFYALENKDLPLGATILVCDVGGGTTDFSLIDVVENGFRRMAVGRHLLLGGDNIDYALAHKIGCDNVHAVRSAKEKMLSTKEPVTFFVEGRGSSIMSGKSYTLTLDDLDLEGFFGIYDFEEAKQIRKSSGIKKVGLAYEAEPSITKQLAYFLGDAKPTHVLFNGGTLKPQIFRDRITHCLQRWFGSIEVLPSVDLELAVSRGAVIFGAHKENRISGGTPRGFYLGIDDKALSLIARGSEENSWFAPDHSFCLRTNQEVTFQLYSSNTRLFDAPGTLVPIEDMTLLPPIQTVLKVGKQKEVEVQLKAHYTQLGTLELYLFTGTHEWKLEFSVRGNDRQRSEEIHEVGELQPAQEIVREAFSPGQTRKVMKELEACLGKPKAEWSPSILRALFEPLISQADKRTLSTEYGARFWNLAGFFLRPGYGHPLDEFRVKELWKLHLADQNLPEEVELQKWICMRRIAGGLSRGQQLQLFSSLLPTIWKKKGLDTRKEYEAVEKLRTLASLELVNHDQKIKLGKALLQRVAEDKAKPVDYWALGRLGARVPLYGSLAHILPRQTCEAWVKELLTLPFHDPEHLSFTLLHLARKTDVREVNLDPELLASIEERFALDLSTPLSHEQQERFFGDSLPSALTLHRPPQ